MPEIELLKEKIEHLHDCRDITHFKQLLLEMPPLLEHFQQEFLDLVSRIDFLEGEISRSHAYLVDDFTA